MNKQPPESAVNEVLNQCSEHADEGVSKFPGMSYEQGVEAGIRWMLGEGSNPMED